MEVNYTDDGDFISISTEDLKAGEGNSYTNRIVIAPQNELQNIGVVNGKLFFEIRGQQEFYGFLRIMRTMANHYGV